MEQEPVRLPYGIRVTLSTILPPATEGGPPIEVQKISVDEGSPDLMTNGKKLWHMKDVIENGFDALAEPAGLNKEKVRGHKQPGT